MESELVDRVGWLVESEIGLRSVDGVGGWLVDSEVGWRLVDRVGGRLEIG